MKTKLYLLPLLLFTVTNLQASIWRQLQTKAAGLRCAVSRIPRATIARPTQPSRYLSFRSNTIKAPTTIGLRSLTPTLSRARLMSTSSNNSNDNSNDEYALVKTALDEVAGRFPDSETNETWAKQLHEVLRAIEFFKRKESTDPDPIKASLHTTFCRRKYDLLKIKMLSEDLDNKKEDIEAQKIVIKVLNEHNADLKKKLQSLEENTKKNKTTLPQASSRRAYRR